MKILSLLSLASVSGGQQLAAPRTQNINLPDPFRELTTRHVKSCMCVRCGTPESR